MALFVVLALFVLALGALSALAFATSAPPIARGPLEDLDRTTPLPSTREREVDRAPRVEVSHADARASDLVHLLRADRIARCGEERPARWATSRSMATCPTCVADLARACSLAVVAGAGEKSTKVIINAVERSPTP